MREKWDIRSTKLIMALGWSVDCETFFVAYEKMKCKYLLKAGLHIAQYWAQYRHDTNGHRVIPQYLHSSVVPNDVFSVNFFPIIRHLLCNQAIHMCPRSALSDFTNIVTRIFAVLKKLTCIAFCAVKIHEIFVICLLFSRGQMKCCWFYWELIFHHLRILSYLYTLSWLMSKDNLTIWQYLFGN